MQRTGEGALGALQGQAMPAARRLQQHRESRNALLERIVAMLLADERVCAAWLAGSLGRGEADDLSDIDLWVIVADEHLELARRQREYVSTVGAPVLIVEAPQNAPAGGAYLMALYAGEAGPQQVDWYWQPRSSAAIPSDVRVLFNRDGVPAAAPVQTELEPAGLAAAEAQVSFFWAMAGISAKYVARRCPWEALTLINMVRTALASAAELAGGQVRAHPLDPALPLLQPEAQMALLRALAREMEALMPALAAQGARLPAAVVPPVERYFDLVEAMIREGVDPGAVLK